MLSLISCLHAHSSDMVGSGPYWICAYALNQHDLENELGSINPKESPFYKAMQLADGTITILDKDCVCYSRICEFEHCCVFLGVCNPIFNNIFSSGCAYEVYLSLADQGARGSTKQGRKYEYDIYTMMNDTRAVGISRDRGEIEEHRAGFLSQFPPQIAEMALTVEIQNAAATRPEDKRAILLAICGDTTINEPPTSHPEYGRVNDLLRGKFASEYRVFRSSGR